MRNTNPSIRFAGFTDEWEEHKLRDLLNKNSEKNKELSILNVESVSNKTGFTKQTEQFEDYSVASADLSNYYIIREKQFAYNPSRINVGSIAYKSVGDDTSVVSPLYVSFSTRNTLSDGFLWNWFKTTSFDAQRQRLSEGGVRDTLSFNQLSNMVISFPEHKNQEKIGSFFKQLDNTIDLHQRQLDLLKEQKKGFLQKMFPKQGAKVPELRFAEFTDAWEQRKWIDTVDMSTNMVDPKTGKYDKLLHIGPGNIESFTGRILDNVNTVKDDNLISGKFHFNPNDIIYGKINPQLAKYTHVNFEGLASADAYVLNSKNGITQDFLYVELQTSGFYKYSVSVSMRTGMPKINRDELNQFSYLAPKNIEEQQKIGSFFKQLDDTITLHQRQLDLLKEQKKSFLQQMFV